MNEDCIESTEGFDNGMALAEHMSEAHSDDQASTPTPAVEEAVVAAVRGCKPSDRLAIAVDKLLLNADFALGWLPQHSRLIEYMTDIVQRNFGAQSRLALFGSAVGVRFR